MELPKNRSILSTNAEDKIGAQIVDAALKVHRQLGPGLLESAYQACLALELRKRGLRVEV